VNGQRTVCSLERSEPSMSYSTYPISSLSALPQLLFAAGYCRLLLLSTIVRQLRLSYLSLGQQAASHTAPPTSPSIFVVIVITTLCLINQTTSPFGPSRGLRWRLSVACTPLATAFWTLAPASA
jgi:hypothetical protein